MGGGGSDYVISSTLQYLSLSLTVSKFITSICIKPCYDYLIKAVDEVVLNKILSKSVDGKQDY